MRAAIRKFAEGVVVAAIAVVVTLLALEFVVFRTILVPDDLLPNKTINGVVRYKPHTVATFRQPDGTTTRVAINAQGWNSKHGTYKTERTDGVARIAVVGDSYVHNRFVEISDTFTARLETGLNARGTKAEVFRFGMDGAPLSQYLHVLRREVVQYRPDVVIVPLIHNDFDEMYRGLKSRYASSFMKLRKTTDGEVAEVAPGTFRPGLADKLRASAAFRYLYYETNLYIHAKSWINRLYWGGSEEWDPAFISSAVDIRKVNDHESNRFFARYVLREMKALSQEHGFRLIIAMDGVRDAIYDGRKPMDYEIGRLNRIARDLTAELGLTFVDFHDTFARDYALHRKRFEFSYDWHWNERANRLVAETLEPLVVQALRPTVQRKTVMLSSQRMPRVPGLREKPAGAECAEKSKPADQKTAGVSEAPPLPARRKSPQNAEPAAVPDPKAPPTRKIPMRDA